MCCPHTTREQCRGCVEPSVPCRAIAGAQHTHVRVGGNHGTQTGEGGRHDRAEPPRQVPGAGGRLRDTVERCAGARCLAMPVSSRKTQMQHPPSNEFGMMQHPPPTKFGICEPSCRLSKNRVAHTPTGGFTAVPLPLSGGECKADALLACKLMARDNDDDYPFKTRLAHGWLVWW